MRRLLIALSFLTVLIIAGCGATTSSAAKNQQFMCTQPANGTGPYTYVAIGASDAVGIGATCASSDGYVPLLGKLMPKNTHVVNLGISGITIDRASTIELPTAIKDQPNIITIWLSANDFRAMQQGGTPTLATYNQELDAFLMALQTQTKAQVFVGNLPDLTKLPAFQHSKIPLTTTADENAAWNDAIATTVAKDGAVLVDLYHANIADHPEYIWIDGFHPSSLGYIQLANAFWTVIQAHGGAK